MLHTEDTRLIKQNYLGRNEEAEEEALVMFGKRLDNEREELVEGNNIVTSADKLQHLLYAADIFEQ